MAGLTELVASSVWVRAILYLIGRLTRDRATRHLVAPLRGLVEALDRAMADTEAAGRALTDAHSGVDAADADLDDQIAAFESALLLAVGRNRKSPRYKKLFPKGLVGATRTDVADQVRQARRIEEGISHDLADLPFATEALAKIAAARESLERQQVVLQEAKNRLLDARAAERTVRVEAFAQYRMLYGDLVKIFPHNLRKVHAFFRRERVAKEPEATDEASPAEAAVPGASTPAPAPSTPAR